MASGLGAPSFVILSGARSAQSKDLLSFVLPRRPREAGPSAPLCFAQDDGMKRNRLYFTTSVSDTVCVTPAAVAPATMA